MGQKDLSQKNLEMYPDVFADIMNALLHEGKKVLKDDQLCLAPTETIFGAGRNELKNQFQDVGMDELRDGRIHTKYMLENQTRIDRRLPMRKAGYHGVIYRRQYAEKQVYPVVGLVLYWGKTGGSIVVFERIDARYTVRGDYRRSKGNGGTQNV